MNHAKYTMTATQIPSEILSDPELGLLSRECLTILSKRGLNTVAEIKHFIHDDLSAVTASYTMKGTAEAVEILKSAAGEKARVVVYRDYDCDGISAGAVAVQCLRNLGIKAEQYANERGIDGFGMCPAGVDNIMSKWPDTKVIMTVDNGITAFDGAAQAAKYPGLKVIITDHHEAGGELPIADSIIDPKQPGETYGYQYLCGAGVVFKLMLALYIGMRKNIKPVVDMIDIVALATVADVVPLIGENHTIVKEGIEKIKTGDRLFFNTLIQKLEIKSIKASGALAFKLGPLVNAVSRMDEDTNMVVEMMLSNDPAFVDQCADKLIEINEERKSLTDFQFEWFSAEAEKILAGNPDATSVVLRNDRATEGIVGIIAGRLKESLGKPVVVFAYNQNSGLLKGSARCGSCFHLKNALDKIPAGILEGYGGHAKAAGLSVKPENYERFVKEFTKITDAELRGKDTAEPREIDLALTERDCTEQLCHELDMLEPYGEGFAPPLFGLKAEPTRASFMGTNLVHLKYILADGTAVILWNEAEWQREREKQGKGMPKKFIGCPAINAFRGSVSIQFMAEYAG